MNEIGLRIKKIRQDLKLSAPEFAKLIDEKLYRLNDIERGKQRTPGDVLSKIMEVFHVDGNWLLNGEGPVYRQPKNPQILQAVEPKAVEPIKAAPAMTASELEMLATFRRLSDEEQARTKADIKNREEMEKIKARLDRLEKQERCA